MDTLKIAFETLLVGALALPWLLLGLHLFFPEVRASIVNALPRSNDTIQFAVVSVLAVAMAYVVGAAVARLAQDFFNDDDLQLPFAIEDSIRASVYCDRYDSDDVTVPENDPWLFERGIVVPAEHASCRDDKSVTIECLCRNRKTDRGEARQKDLQRMQQIFRVQESVTLLLGEEDSSQLRHLHQQLQVLQGATFDGLLTWLLCVMALNRNIRSTWLRFAFPSVLLAYVFFALVWNHLEIHHLNWWPRILRWPPNDPPFTELTIMFVAVVGIAMAWRANKTTPPTGTVHEERPPGMDITYARGLFITTVLTALAYAGWYWTEIYYDQMVIYSYYAHSLK